MYCSSGYKEIANLKMEKKKGTVIKKIALLRTVVHMPKEERLKIRYRKVGVYRAVLIELISISASSLGISIKTASPCLVSVRFPYFFDYLKQGNTMRKGLGYLHAKRS